MNLLLKSFVILCVLIPVAAFDNLDRRGNGKTRVCVNGVLMEVWGRPTPHEFEDSAVMLPEDFDAHLRNEYVKFHYMTLPPESCRHPSHSYSWHCPWWLGLTKGEGSASFASKSI